MTPSQPTTRKMNDKGQAYLCWETGSFCSHKLASVDHEICSLRSELHKWEAWTYFSSDGLQPGNGIDTSGASEEMLTVVIGYHSAGTLSRVGRRDPSD